MLAHRLRLPVVLGYILAGIVVGPHTLGPTVRQVEDVETLADLGVVLLLFTVGLELPLERLAAVRLLAVAGTPVQMLLSGLLGWEVGRLLGCSSQQAVWVGVMVSVSSTLVVLRCLEEHGLGSSPTGQAMTAVLVVQDLMVIPMIIVLPTLSDLQQGMQTLVTSLTHAVLFIGLLATVGRHLLPWLLDRVEERGNRELFALAVAAAGLGIGYMAHELGLSAAFGAFLAGIALSRSKHHHQALADALPLRDLFCTIFFVSVGMLINPTAVWQHAGAVVLVTVGVYLGKALIFAGVGRACGTSGALPLMLGLGLGQIGEFSFVLARLGHSLNAIPETPYLVLMAAAALSMGLTPLALGTAIPLHERLHPHATLPAKPLPRDGTTGAAAAGEDPGSLAPTGRVVLAGCTETALVLRPLLEGSNLHPLLIETHLDLVTYAREAGLEVVHGHLGDPSVQVAARLSEADLLVASAFNDTVTATGLESLRTHYPHLEIVIRADGPREHRALLQAGMEEVIVPEVEAAVTMLRRVLHALGCPAEAVEQQVRRCRDLYTRDDTYGRGAAATLLSQAPPA